MASAMSSDAPVAVLSISSQVAFGPVGNSAAVPAMERHGFTVCAVPTIVLSFHPGHGPPAGLRVPARDLSAILDSLVGLGVLAGCRGVLTGYFAANDQIFGVARTIRTMKTVNPSLLYLCDPVLGDDDSGLYVAQPVAEAVRDELLPLADATTPNAFELRWLTGLPVDDVVTARRAAAALKVATVVATSVPDGDEMLATLAFGAGEDAVRTRRRDQVPHGTGDLLAGLFLARRLLGEADPDALASTVAIVERVIDASAGSGALNLRALAA